jgi:hypothetical protein
MAGRDRNSSVVVSDIAAVLSNRVSASTDEIFSMCAIYARTLTVHTKSAVTLEYPTFWGQNRE